MAFGPAPQQQQGGDGERYESRNLTIVSGEEKTTSTGKLYWRVKDSDGKFYTVWESVVKINLEMAAGKGESILCAVKVEKKGDKTFYNITGTGAAAEDLVAAGTAKAQAASQPGAGAVRPVRFAPGPVTAVGGVPEGIHQIGVETNALLPQPEQVMQLEQGQFLGQFDVVG